jgi:phosphopantothenate synthetase
VSIVDDIERAMGNLIAIIKEKKKGKANLAALLDDYDNRMNLRDGVKEIVDRLKKEELLEL